MPTILLSTRANMNCQTNEQDRKEYPGMSSHSLVVLIHCKTGWIESRQLRLSTGEVFLYFHHKGYNSPIIMQGVALPVSKEAQKALIAWEVQDPKVHYCILQTGEEDMVQRYGQTNNISEEVKHSPITCKIS